MCDQKFGRNSIDVFGCRPKYRIRPEDLPEFVMNSDPAEISQNSSLEKGSDGQKCCDLDTGSEKVIIVAVKAGKEISRNALAWALTHAVRPGDCITLLAVFYGENRGRRLWSFPKFAGDCASGHRKSQRGNSPDRKCQITDCCSQMMLQFHGVYDQNKINVSIKIISGSPAGGVAAESKRAGANWVVLDKQLKQEQRHCMEELQCNIVVMKRSTPKVLRLNLGQISSQEPQLPHSSSSSPEERRAKLLEKRVKHSTPNSSPEEEITPFTASTEIADSLMSSSEMGSSPYFIPGRNPLFDHFAKGELSFLIEENEDTDEAVTAFDSDGEGTTTSLSPQTNQERATRDSSASDFELSLQNPSVLSRSLAQNSFGDKWVPPNCAGEQIQMMENHTRTQRTKAPTGQTLLEKFIEFDRIRDENQCRDPFYRSSVREAVSLGRNSPSAPPPLCSICQHKAPVFGKPPRWFSYVELEIATGGFSKANFLAEGGFGSVHRGNLEDGQAVAVKQLKVASSQGDVEFCAEVEVLSCAQHRNVVMLIGFCVEDRRRVLVYEYVCNGSLDFHLYGRSRAPLGWNARQKIAVGAARGLRYLHEDCRVGCIIHRDMRPKNILITHDFEPLVGDFGLARWQPDGDMGAETRVIGTFGYLAPEYTESGQITEKADVYAFGVVLAELITGRRAIDMNRPEGQQFLAEWVRPLLEQGPDILHLLLDPQLDPCFVGPQLHSMIHAASLCLRQDPHSRPRMSKILRILEGDLVTVSSCSGTPGFNIESVGSISGRMRALSPHTPIEHTNSLSPRAQREERGSSLSVHTRSELRGNHFPRLSHDALKAVYGERKMPHTHAFPTCL